MTYTPRRDHRFEYIWEAMSFVEENQCSSCMLRGDQDEYPMMGCTFGIDVKFIDEVPIEEIDDLGNDGISCHKYEPETATRR